MKEYDFDIRNKTSPFYTQFSVSSPLHSDGDLNLCLMPSNIPVTCLLPNRRVLKQDIDSVPLPAIIDIVNKLEFVYYWTASLYFLSCQHTEVLTQTSYKLLSTLVVIVTTYSSKPQQKTHLAVLPPSLTFFHVVGNFIMVSFDISS